MEADSKRAVGEVALGCSILLLPPRLHQPRCSNPSGFLVLLVQVIGPSMLPTLSATGDLLLLERLSTRFQKVKAGDIVMALSPENPTMMVCKRVLALEGDNVAISPAPNIGEVAKHVVVPKGHVWLQGDNTSNSTDSRHYGAVPYALLQGKVFLRIWPPNSWRRF